MEKFRIGTIAAALMLATGALPATSQEPSPEPLASADEGDSGPPLAGLNEEQILTFFTLMSASAEVEDFVGPMIETMLEPGEAVPGWREGGIDILTELGARNGGVSGNLLRDDDTEVLSITDLSGTSAPDLTDFTNLYLRTAPPGDANEIAYASFAPGMWLALEMQHTRRANALCYKGLNGVTLYSRTPLTTWDADTVYLMAAMIAMFDRVAAREVCMVYEKQGDAYRVRSFLPDGRRLPQMDSQASPLRIMPAAELSAFMQSSVPVPSAE